MGYRSDVTIAAEFESREIRDAAMTAAKLRYQLRDDNWEIFQDFQETGIVFEVEGWKWYGSYPEVTAIEEMFKQFWHEDFDANVKVVMVGEETDDMTEDLYECAGDREPPDWFWDIYIARSIQAPWGKS